MIESTFPGTAVELIGGGRGDFIVVTDGTTLWDKRKVGRFPEPREILEAMGA